MSNYDLARMTLGEQEEWELLTNCSMSEMRKRGLTGKRLAALIYIFDKRNNPSVKFEDYLKLEFEAATDLLTDSSDNPKENNS